MTSEVQIQYGPVKSRIATPLPASIEQQLFEALRFQVEGYYFAEKFQNRQWDGYKECYSKTSHQFRSGLVHRVCKHLSDLGYQPVLNGYPALQLVKPLADIKYLRDWQREAIPKVLEYRRCGIWAPPRSGKTVFAAGLIDGLRKFPVVYFCERIEIAVQVVEKFNIYVPDVSVGLVGNGEMKFGDITIITVQSAMYAYGKMFKPEKGEEVEPPPPDKVGVRNFIEAAKTVVYDEYHHVGHESGQFVTSKIRNAECIVGLSATPWSAAGEDLILERAVGPVGYKVTYSYLIERGLLLPPYIYFYKLPKLDGLANDEAYPTIYKEYIVENTFRNSVIARTAREFKALGWSNVILVDFIRHGEILKKRFIPNAILITGRDNKTKRKAVVDYVNGGGTDPIITTLWGEGVDIPCHSPETSILVDGYRPVAIKDVKVGDVVLTHKSRFRPVTGVSETPFDGELLRIRVVGNNEPVEVTPDHLMLRCNDNVVEQIHARDLKLSDRLVLAKPDFGLKPSTERIDLVEFLQLQSNKGYVWDDDHVWNKFSNTKTLLSARQIAELTGIPDHTLVQDFRQGQLPGTRSLADARKKLEMFFEIHKDQVSQAVKIPRYLPVNEQLCRLLGYYIAEGSYPATFSFHAKETEYIDDVRTLVRLLFGDSFLVTEEVVGNGYGGTYNNKIVADFLVTVCGSRARNKHVPDFVLFHGDRENARNVLIGMWRGDGGSGRRSYGYTTVSRTLAYQYRFLLSLFGIYGHVEDYGGEYNVEVAGVDWATMQALLNEKDSDPNEVPTTSRHRVFLNWFVLPIVRITTRKYTGSVFSLSVKDDQTYTTHALTVHNCLRVVTIACGGASSIEVFQHLRSITPFPDKDKGIVIDFGDDAHFLRGHSNARKKFYESESSFHIQELNIRKMTLEEVESGRGTS